MTGTIINTGAIIVGSIIGLLLKNVIPLQVSQRLMEGIGLFTLTLGFTMVLDSNNLLFVLISLVIGALIGELLSLEEKFDSLGDAIKSRTRKSAKGFTRAFVASSLLFCIGPMAVLGAIENGLTGEYTLLLTKSVLDGISAVAFASTLGIGVIFSAGTLFFYQGTISLLAEAAGSVLTAAVIGELTATGGILIVGLGLNLLGIGKIKVTNFLPALLGPIFFGLYFFN